MQAGDKDAVWLMQGWLFLSGFWSNDRTLNREKRNLYVGSKIPLEPQSSSLSSLRHCGARFEHFSIFPFIFYIVLMKPSTFDFFYGPPNLPQTGQSKGQSLPERSAKRQDDHLGLGLFRQTYLDEDELLLREAFCVQHAAAPGFLRIFLSTVISQKQLSL